MSDGIKTFSNGVSQKALTIGTRCWVKVGNTAQDAEKVGFVDSMRATKNIQLQRAQVCGALLPASIDPQGYSVNISLSGFLATAAVHKAKGVNINGFGQVSLQSFNPSSEDFIQGDVATKFPYMAFVDDKTGQILATFSDVITSSFAITVNAGTYSKADIQMEAIDMSDGKAYTDQELKNAN